MRDTQSLRDFRGSQQGDARASQQGEDGVSAPPLPRQKMWESSRREREGRSRRGGDGVSPQPPLTTPRERDRERERRIEPGRQQERERATERETRDVGRRPVSSLKVT